MKIVVAMKQVPSRDSELRIAPSGTRIEEAGLSWEINEPDAYALEAGVHLKEQHGGEVITVCAGPESATKRIRDSLAKGADRAIHLETDPAPADPLAAARLLATAIKSENPDLILTGPQSDDMGYGQTGVILSELLGVPHASIVMQVEVYSEGIRVKRELEGGWFQFVDLPLPALLTIQSGISKLRYATLMGIKKARSKEIQVIAAAVDDIPGASRVVVDRLYQLQRTKQTQLFQGTPGEAAAQLVEKLKFEVRVL